MADNVTLYGCTLKTTDPYPYATNPVTISIEGDYLLDVVPRESNPERDFKFTPLEVKAQAIAARNYAYSKIQSGLEIDNSSANQTFVPYFFDRLGEYVNANPTKRIPLTTNPCVGGYFNDNNKATYEQSVVCQAVAAKQYVTLSNTDVPFLTEYSADWPGGVIPDLETAPKIDPISGAVGTPCGVFQDQKDASHGRGMTQLGANRWARGDRCALEDRGSDPWSVRWDRPEQILTHYYTGIDIRDITTKSVLTPAYRWNPLEIDWGTSNRKPPEIHSGTIYSITMQVQNTGVSTWACPPGTQFKLGYRWQRTYRDDDRTITEQQPSSNRADVCGLIPGAAQTVNLTINDLPVGWDTNTASLYFASTPQPANSARAAIGPSIVRTSGYVSPQNVCGRRDNSIWPS